MYLHVTCRPFFAREANENDAFEDCLRRVNGPRQRFIMPTLQAYYNCIGRAQYFIILCILCKVRGFRFAKTTVPSSGGPQKLSRLSWMRSAVARRISGLIKHAILLVIQSLSTPRDFICPAPSLHLSHAGTQRGFEFSLRSPFYKLDYIRFSRVTEAFWEINLPYAKRPFIPRPNFSINVEVSDK